MWTNICCKFTADSGGNKNSENRLTFGEVAEESLVSCFFSDSQCGYLSILCLWQYYYSECYCNKTPSQRVRTNRLLGKTGTYIKFIIQLQSMGHMSLKTNTRRMHHITPFWDEKFINFLGRGIAACQTPVPQPPSVAAYGASILASSALDLRPPNVPVALTPTNQKRCLRRPVSKIVWPTVHSFCSNEKAVAAKCRTWSAVCQSLMASVC